MAAPPKLNGLGLLCPPNADDPWPNAVPKGDVPEVLEVLPNVPKGLELVVVGAPEFAPNVLPVEVFVIDDACPNVFDDVLFSDGGAPKENVGVACLLSDMM